MPLVGDLVQQRAIAVRVAGKKHLHIADTQRGGIDPGHPLVVKRNAQRVQPQPIDVGATPYRDQHGISLEDHARAAHADRVARILEFGGRARMQAHLSLDQRAKGLQHLTVINAGQRFGCVEPSHIQPQPGQGLGHLDPDGAHADHPDATGQVVLLEQAVRGQDPVSEVPPGSGHHRAAAWREDDRARLDLVAIHLQPAGPQKPRAARHGAVAQLVGYALRPFDEPVTHPAHSGEHGRDVGAQPLGTLNAELIEGQASVKRVRRLDQRLRWHAAHGGAGGAPMAVVHHKKIVGIAAHLTQGGQPGAPRAHDDGVDLHGLIRLHQPQPWWRAQCPAHAQAGCRW